MSSASLANLLLDLMECDWTEVSLKDIECSLKRARTTSDVAGFILPKTHDALDWARSLIDGSFHPLLNKAKRERISNALIPPGSCIHFCWDGKGHSGSFVPCDFFSSVDFARTLIDDHMTTSGCHRALLTIFRDWEQNYNASCYKVQFHFTVYPIHSSANIFLLLVTDCRWISLTSVMTLPQFQFKSFLNCFSKLRELLHCNLQEFPRKFWRGAKCLRFCLLENQASPRLVCGCAPQKLMNV